VIPEWMKSVWRDPVLSKVIAAGILGGAGWLIVHYGNRSAPVWVLVLSVCLISMLTYALLRRRVSGGSDATGLNAIKIAHPGPGEVLTDGQPMGSGRKFPIRGTLKSLPNEHDVWILTKDDATGQVWPQGFSPVVFNQHQGTWTGWIFVGGNSELRIIAVVAPPTSQEFFRYFQKVGGVRGNKFEALVRVPPECVNQHSVQARVPKP
jgi:hypothetical protein